MLICCLLIDVGSDPTDRISSKQKIIRTLKITSMFKLTGMFHARTNAVVYVVSNSALFVFKSIHFFWSVASVASDEQKLCILLCIKICACKVFSQNFWIDIVDIFQQATNIQTDVYKKCIDNSIVKVIDIESVMPCRN